MELQINDLITSIKKDGIEKANSEAEKIIADAKQKAAKIIENANAEAEKIKEKSAAEIEILKDSVRVSAEHAERDAMLSFKKSVQTEYENLLAADVKKCVNSDTLARLIKAAINGEDASLYTAEVSEITDALKGELAKEINDGLEIKISKSVKVGFKLAAKDGSGYFDCTDDEIVKMLMPFFPTLNI